MFNLLSFLPEDSQIEKNQESCADIEKKESEFGGVREEGKKPGKIVEEVGARGSVEGSVYLKYFTTGGGWVSVILLVLLNLTNQTLYSGSDVWLSHWTKGEENLTREDSPSLPAPSLPSNISTLEIWTSPDWEDHYYYLAVYSAIIVSLLLASMLRTVHFFNLSMNSSINLHDKMFERLLRAPPRFFDVNPAGGTRS